MDIVTHKKTCPDQAFILFGAESLMEQLSALAREVDGVLLAQDPEFVHRMRVASRRLRTRLLLFRSCLPDHKAAVWNKQIRSITKALGNARDTDVQIIFVSSFLEKLSGREKDGVKRLLLRLTQVRERVQKQVRKAIRRVELSGVLKDLEETCRTIRGTLIIRERGNLTGSSYRVIYDEISARVAEMLGYSIYINDPARLTELHEMRIAAKHLRYSMEAFEPLHEKSLKKPIKIVKTIQEMLGDIHDCDVWIEYLPSFLSEERLRAIEYTGSARSVGRLKPGIVYMEVDRRDFRRKRYQEFLTFWEKNTHVWPELLGMLSSLAEGEESQQEIEEKTLT